jgi:hypothetical protein
VRQRSQPGIFYSTSVSYLHIVACRAVSRQQTLIDASKEVGLEVNAEKTVHVAVSSPKCKEKSGHKDR